LPAQVGEASKAYPRFGVLAHGCLREPCLDNTSHRTYSHNGDQRRLSHRGVPGGRPARTNGSGDDAAKGRMAMRNREGRRGGARTTQVGSVWPAAWALAAWVAEILWSPAAMAEDGRATSTTWLVRSVAGDTQCAVLDDGRTAHLQCVGDHIDERGLRLVRVEGQAAVFAVHGGQASALHVRVAVGASFDATAVRARWMETIGPRPGWIEEQSIAQPEPRR
jgi:hypothetical protein